MCDYCDAEFSEDDNASDYDIDPDDRDNSGGLSDEEGGRQHRLGARGAGGIAGRRRAQVDIATIEEVLGEDEEGSHTNGTSAIYTVLGRADDSRRG